MKERIGILLSHVGTCLRLVVITMGVCCLIYPLVILAVGQSVTPYTANGWLLKNGLNNTIGSEIIGQEFHSPRYFWPRPSAVDYNAAMSGGSNLSPASPLLTKRAEAIIRGFGASVHNPIPPDLVTASGSGLDPDISLRAAEFQVKRVAAARHLPEAVVEKLVRQQTFTPGGLLTLTSLVNVLDLNRSLDRVGGK